MASIAVLTGYAMFKLLHSGVNRMSKLRIDYNYMIKGEKKEGSFEVEERWEDLDIYEAIVEAEKLSFSHIAGDRNNPKKRVSLTNLYLSALKEADITSISRGVGTPIGS